jgi:hypothetical protein
LELHRISCGNSGQCGPHPEGHATDFARAFQLPRTGSFEGELRPPGNSSCEARGRVAVTVTARREGPHVGIGPQHADLFVGLLVFGVRSTWVAR